MNPEQHENAAFHYTYSARQQEEIRNIRKKYMPPEEDKMEQLRRLDQGVAQKATAVSLAVGLIGALLLGIGMCCCMVWQNIWFFVGIPLGLIGIALICCAYPAYHRTLRRERARIAPQVLRLTDELMK